MKNRALVLLSGEATTIPAAEARALFLAGDPRSTFERPEERVLLAETMADPYRVGARVAFSRRVGFLVDDSDLAHRIGKSSVRVRAFSTSGRETVTDPRALLRGHDVRVDLETPDLEVTVVEGRERYVTLTSPTLMRQAWATRRPRRRPFFHPAAIFPKLARALVNLSRCREGGVFLEPFSGTGSLALEASEVGAEVVCLDVADRMVKGSKANMRAFGQEWVGIVRCDSLHPPIHKADAAATDVPYGRASSTLGNTTRAVIDRVLEDAPSYLGRGCRMVVMHPGSVPLESTEKLEVEEEHEFYVNSRLSRTVSVLVRR